MATATRESYALSLHDALPTAPNALLKGINTQMLQWNSFADTAYTHLFPDGQYAAGSGRAELKQNSTNLMPAGVPGNGDVLGAANPQVFAAPYFNAPYAHRE